MNCPKCQASVPDESLFCLRCGARLRVPAERAPMNGGGTSAHTSAETRVKAPAGKAPAGKAPAGATAAPLPGGKQPYTLSFKALADERLRYRVARWVCEMAPAHPLSEVQEGLTQGEFATFLALTQEEAEATKQRIQALGAHPALWRLSPSSPAELLLPERPSRKVKKKEDEWTPRRKFAAVGIALLALFLLGAIAAQHFQAALTVPPVQRMSPRSGGQP